MNTVEWAVKDGVPYAIDFMNPAPDMDVHSITQPYHVWCVQHMADMVIRMAKADAGQIKDARWSKLF